MRKWDLLPLVEWHPETTISLQVQRALATLMLIPFNHILTGNTNGDSSKPPNKFYIFQQTFQYLNKPFKFLDTNSHDLSFAYMNTTKYSHREIYVMYLTNKLLMTLNTLI